MIRYEIELPAATGVNRAATSGVRWAAAGFFPGLAAAGLLNALEVNLPFALVLLVCMTAGAICGAAWGRSYPTRVSRWFHPDRTPDDLRGPLERAFNTIRQIPDGDVGLFGHFDKLVEVAEDEVAHLDEVIRFAAAAEDQTRALSAKEQRNKLANGIRGACARLEGLAAEAYRLEAKRAQLGSAARKQGKVVTATRRLARLDARRNLALRRGGSAPDLETLQLRLADEADRLAAHSAAIDEVHPSPGSNAGVDEGAVAQRPGRMAERDADRGASPPTDLR